ncbi:MAG TPA: ribosome biogenesis GTP-binding protein YihA/YsxC [Candidatus Krumholzibacteria bacterium]|nr:ribosome biogenesis GTP-binding protein YihA/YsxC [Candidatus Krumholzibacteria bacterium]
MHHEVELITLAPDLAHCPDSELPEMAFSGRSNVGKSSLLNLLVGRRRVAHTSGQPGKTRALSYYLVDQSWHLVDMPGYGYARTSQAERRRWAGASRAYLSTRSQLRGVFQLIDLKVGVTPDDRARLRDLLRFNRNFCIIFTKADKVSASKREDKVVEHLSGLGLPATTGVIVSSAKDRLGHEEIWAWVEDHLRPQAAENPPPTGD